MKEGLRSLPPLPLKQPEPPSRPQCTVLFSKLQSQEDPPTPQETEELHQAVRRTKSTEAGRLACKACVEDPALKLIGEGHCPGVDLRVLGTVLLNLREPTSAAWRKRNERVLAGEVPKPAPAVDKDLSQILRGLPPPGNPDEEGDKPLTVRQDLGYAS